MSKHKKLSFLKSGIRILGYILGMLASVGCGIVGSTSLDSIDGAMVLFIAFAILIVSEVIGIVEEFGEK
jgi:hypothetical protein